MKPITLFILLITLLLSITINPHFVPANETEQQALLAIKAEISSDPRSVLSSWNKSLHHCQWRGVICGHRHQRVVSLILFSNDLAGTLSPFVGNLTFLSRLDLFNNSFHGNIPLQITTLPRLKILYLMSNYFEGEIPSNLSRCSRLELLSLTFNNLTGKIPPQLSALPSLRQFDAGQNNLYGRFQDIGIGNFSALQSLVLSVNHLEGDIPDDIGKLNLIALGLNGNLLSGTIPKSIYNLSNLYALDLGRNKFNGELPQDLGLLLPHLSTLYLAHCSLVGKVPPSLSNLSELVNLDISFNSFEGNFFINGNNMPSLSKLYVRYAFSLGGEAIDLGFLDTLNNCTSLTLLIVRGNSFTGRFPSSILNLSTSLQVLDIGENQIFGQIPLGLGKFVNMVGLWMDYCQFTNLIPLDIGEMRSLQGLYLSYNNLSREIPSSMGNLSGLFSIDLRYNNFQGSLPKSLGNLKNLEQLYLTANKFSGSFPRELFVSSGLIILDLSQNKFEGSFPFEISGLQSLDVLDVSQNRFSGEIPSTLGECTTLTSLSMSLNFFFGPIPKTLSPLKSIQQLDLSCNNFSGKIPNYFSTWPYLSNLNLSFNNLGGEVPTDGIFTNTSVVSLVGNSKLCGGVPMLHLPRCSKVPKPKKRRIPSPSMILIISISGVMIVALSLALCYYFLYSSKKRKDPILEPENANPFLEVSYQMLHAATRGFSLSNLLGIGGFGSVYKGVLHQYDGTELQVAVKVMNLQNHRAGNSFIVECNTLRNIRHRNLVKVITACSSIDAKHNDFKALIYEFMPKGSLEDWLHSPNRVLNTSTEKSNGRLTLSQRLGITIDVANALEYLHIECAYPIIHCDLKPSNILLDDDMTAHVGDFGLAKFVSGALNSNSTDPSSSTQVRGTIGYAAPEYGVGSKVSPEGDMYSFGIIILELMTSKKPTDPMFNNSLNLHDYAKSTPVMEIIDHEMLGNDEVLHSKENIDIEKIECIKSIIMIGVHCSMEQPQNRMKINDVVNEFNLTRKNLQTRTKLK